MNKTTTKRLEKVAETLRNLRNEIDTMSEKENRNYNETPEGLRESTRGRNAFHNIDNLENAVGYLDESLVNIDNILMRMNDD